MRRASPKSSFSRGVVGRVAAEHHERLDPPRGHLPGEVRQVPHPPPAHVAQLVEGHRGAHRAQGLVDPVDQGVDRGRLAAAGDHERPGAGGAEVLGDEVDPGANLGGQLAARRRAGHSQPAGERDGEGAHLRGREAHPVVGVGAGHRERRLDGVEAVHPPGLVRPPAAGEAAGVGEGLPLGQERVGVEGEDRPGALEVVDRPRRPARRGLDAGEHALLAGRLPDHPARRREAFGEAPGEARRGGGGEGLGEDRQAPAVARLGRDLAPGLGEVVPGRFLRRLIRRLIRSSIRSGALRGAGAGGVAHRPEAVRVVEVEDRRLHPGRGGAARGRVELVALDLGRAALVALDQHAERVGAEGHGGGVALGEAHDPPLGGVDVGHDVLHRPAAGGQAGEAEGGAHQAEHGAPGDAPRGLRGAHRELPLEPLAALAPGAGGDLVPHPVAEPGIDPGRVEQPLDAPPVPLAGAFAGVRRLVEIRVRHRSSLVRLRLRPARRMKRLRLR